MGANRAINTLWRVKNAKSTQQHRLPVISSAFIRKETSRRRGAPVGSSFKVNSAAPARRCSISPWLQGLQWRARSMQIEAHQDALLFRRGYTHKSIMQIALDASNRFSFSANELDYHVTTPRPFPRPPRAARNQRRAHRRSSGCAAASTAPLSASSFRRASPAKLNVVSPRSAPRANCAIASRRICCN